MEIGFRIPKTNVHLRLACSVPWFCLTTSLFKHDQSGWNNRKNVSNDYNFLQVAFDGIAVVGTLGPN